MDSSSIVSIIITLLASEEDFNFRLPSSSFALPRRSPLSFGTIRHRCRSSRSPGGISLIFYDNNNGDERREQKEEVEERSRKDEEDDDDNGDQAPCRACEKQPYRSAIAPWKPESVSNHRGRVSLCRAPVLRLVSLPLSLSRSRSPRVLRAIAFRFLAPRVGWDPGRLATRLFS